MTQQQIIRATNIGQIILGGATLAIQVVGLIRDRARVNKIDV